MPPADRLSPSILAALGLAFTETYCACLMYASDKISITSGSTGDTGGTDTASDTDRSTDTTEDTGDLTETGTVTETGLPTDTGTLTDTGGGSGSTTIVCLTYTFGQSAAPAGPPPAQIFERIEAERVLPEDVLARIKQKTR